MHTCSSYIVQNFRRKISYHFFFSGGGTSMIDNGIIINVFYISTESQITTSNIIANTIYSHMHTTRTRTGCSNTLLTEFEYTIFVKKKKIQNIRTENEIVQSRLWHKRWFTTIKRALRPTFQRKHKLARRMYTMYVLRSSHNNINHQK